jgi:hypothetical protein
MMESIHCSRPICTIITLNQCFDKITIELDPKYYNKKSIVIERDKLKMAKQLAQLDGAG